MDNLGRLAKVAWLGELRIPLPVLLLFLMLEELLLLTVALIPGLAAKTNAGNGAKRLS